MDTKFVLLWSSMFLPEFNLCKDLIRERVTHYETWMTMSTTQVHETTFCQQNDVFTVGHLVPIDLWFDIFFSQFSFGHLASISQSKCPMLQTSVSSCICSKCSGLMISQQPVVVTNM